MINFGFNETKAAEAGALLLFLNQNKMNYTKFIKLLYLIDREALKRFNRPITGDYYCSLHNGPILSRVYDFIKSGPIKGFGDQWHELIKKNKYDVELQKSFNITELSVREESLINEIDEQFKHCNYQEMIAYCHTLPEWKDPIKQNQKSSDLTIEEILQKIKKSPDEINGINDDAALTRFVDSINSNF